MTPEDAPGLIDLIVDHEGWDTGLLSRVAESSARATIHHLGRDPDRYEISLLACGDEKIAELNKQFRDKHVPTNVLSWPSAGEDMWEGDPTEFLGDLALAYGVCKREADESAVKFEDHVAHLIVHGVLHLFGYDHIEDDEAEEMETIESKVLAGIGIANPYQ